MDVKKNLMTFEKKPITSKRRIDTMFKTRLYRTCDGAGLRQSADVPQAHLWISDGTNLMSGRDYITCIHTRYNNLFNRSRTSRGRPQKEHLCSRGCQQAETLNHILQSCYSTHGMRIKRHDANASYIARSADNRGYTVHREPCFNTSGGVLKPDLVLYSPDRTIVVDVQVITDQFPLSQAHQNKRSKYSILEDQLKDLRPGGVPLTSCTLNWRGNMAIGSFTELVGFGIKKKDIKIISTRALLGGGIIWRCFRNMMSKRPKKGIG